MPIIGDTYYSSCPVCGTSCNAAEHNLWKIPFSKVENCHYGKLSLPRLPLLNSEDIYWYTQCPNTKCRTVFLDPCPSTYWDNRDNDHHVRKAQTRQDWPSYQTRVHELFTVSVPTYDLVIDVATGGCQCLTIMKELSLPWKRMIATDIRNSSVQYAKLLGFEGYQHDICDPNVPWEGKANYIIFAEAFEHVRSPLLAFHRMVDLLAPEGYLYTTAIAREGALPIRPGENMMTTEEALQGLVQSCGLQIRTKLLQSGRWKLILQKP